MNKKEIKTNLHLSTNFPSSDYSNPYYGKYNDPCYKCQNNPKNNKYATGNCNCTLPDAFNANY